MTEDERLQMLKMEIPISTNAFDKQLKFQLSAAQELIGREGITLDLDSSHEDNIIVIQYAAFLFKKKRDPGIEFPKHLRIMMNNRLFSQKAGGGHV